MVTDKSGVTHDTAPDPSKCGHYINPVDWLAAVARGDTQSKLPPSSNFHTLTHQGFVRSIVNDITASTDLAIDKTPIVLYHTDFSMQNIIVRSDDPTVIAGIIDWEGARTVPMWATNPCFRWPIFSPFEEQHHFHRILRDNIMAKTPEWRRAFREETVSMSLLEQRMRLRMAGAHDLNWSVPSRHFLSADIEPLLGIIYLWCALFPVQLIYSFKCSLWMGLDGEGLVTKSGFGDLNDSKNSSINSVR